MIRVQLPFHLRTIAGVEGEMTLEVDNPATIGSVLDGLERRFPNLRGTIRDHVTLERRPMVRFFACEKDFSHDPLDTALPSRVANGEEPFMIVGAIAGG
jgi:hypothetical protein